MLIVYSPLSSTEDYYIENYSTGSSNRSYRSDAELE